MTFCQAHFSLFSTLTSKLRQRVGVEILLHLFLVVVGDRDECLAEDNSETVNALYLWHAYDVRTMSTQELGMWQEVFELLHGHE